MKENGKETKTELHAWLTELASSAPTPGGGGAAALTGAEAFALCAMAASLTVGKPKYESVRPDMERILHTASEKTETLHGLIGRDAAAFEPLSRAYGIPKDAPGRDGILENALREASSVPAEILRELSFLPPLLEELLEKGSRLLVSDVGCAASLCRAASECALFNVLVNTRLMKDRAFADALASRAAEEEKKLRERCEGVAAAVKEKLV